MRPVRRPTRLRGFGLRDLPLAPLAARRPAENAVAHQSPKAASHCGWTFLSVSGATAMNGHFRGDFQARRVGDGQEDPGEEDAPTEAVEAARLAEEEERASRCPAGHQAIRHGNAPGGSASQRVGGPLQPPARSATAESRNHRVGVSELPMRPLKALSTTLRPPPRPADFRTGRNGQSMPSCPPARRSRLGGVWPGTTWGEGGRGGG